MIIIILYIIAEKTPVQWLGILTQAAPLQDNTLRTEPKSQPLMSEIIF